MRARTGVSAESLIHGVADQRKQRKILGTSESLLRQQKRLRADKVAMCRDKRLNSQTLKGQALCWVREKEFQHSGNSGVSGENSA
jgi:hypothetical protein